MIEVRRKVSSGGVKFLGLGDRQIRVVASDATPDRAGDVVVPAGCKLENYRRNPVVLAQHDHTQPIARCSSIGIEGNAVMATVQFPDTGVSALADEYCALAKAGIVSAVSVGFMPLEYQPRKEGGLRFTSWELLELSLVSVGANPSALVVGKRLDSRGARLAEARNVRAQIELIGKGYTSYEAQLIVEARRAPAGTCSRKAGQPCGLKDPAQCAVHASQALAR